jgi:hypothetical protein
MPVKGCTRKRQLSDFLPVEGIGLDVINRPNQIIAGAKD